MTDSLRRGSKMRPGNTMIVLATLIFSACVSGTGDVEEEAGITGYDCDDFGKATFRMTGSESAELVLGVKRYPLRQQRSASGARFTGPDVEFWSRGTEAMLIVNQSTDRCEVRGSGL